MIRRAFIVGSCFLVSLLGACASAPVKPPTWFDSVGQQMTRAIGIVLIGALFAFVSLRKFNKEWNATPIPGRSPVVPLVVGGVVAAILVYILIYFTT